MRDFSLDIYLLVAAALGMLSWTTGVEFFRLGIPSVYEHMLAYASLAIVMIAAKGLRNPTVFEISLIIMLSATTEALKYHFPFRHPKTSDFFADMLGLFAVITLFYSTKNIARLLRRAIRIPPLPSARQITY